MGRPYYYFTASLPALSFTSKPPFTSEEYLSECRRLLADDDYQLMEKLFSSDETECVKSGNAVYHSYCEFNRNCCNEMAWFRAERAEKDPLEHIRGDRYSQPFIAQLIYRASEAEDPLRAEKILDEAKWQYLDSLETIHFFNIEFLLIYGLKLKILERYEKINSDLGQQRFEKIKKQALEYERKVDFLIQK